MLREKLKNHSLILASASPRRHHFFKELDLDFTINVRSVNEVYDPALKEAQITDYLAKLKASVFLDLKENDILITSDTIVWKDGKPLEKAKNKAEAKAMLQDLSGAMHEVFTSVCFTGIDFQKIVNDRTKVWFKELSEAEIDYYIETCQPFDKAGSYGIQEWLGYIGIEKIEGCYFNVMGLPTRLVYKALMTLFEE